MANDNLIEGRKKAYLQREIKYNGKIMSNKEWLDTLIKEGKKPIVKEVVDTAKKNQILNDWEHIKNIYPMGNTSHPQTIEAMRLKKIIQNEDYPKKNEYRAMGEDGSFSVLEKFGYEYIVDALSKKENVEDSSFDEYKKDKENHDYFIQNSKGKEWEIVDEHSDYGSSYFSGLTKQDRNFFETISIDENGKHYVSIGFIGGKSIIIGDRYDYKSPLYDYSKKEFNTVQEAISELDKLVKIQRIKDMGISNAEELYEESLAKTEREKINPTLRKKLNKYINEAINIKDSNIKEAGIYDGDFSDELRKKYGEFPEGLMVDIDGDGMYYLKFNTNTGNFEVSATVYDNKKESKNSTRKEKREEISNKYALTNTEVNEFFRIASVIKFDNKPTEIKDVPFANVLLSKGLIFKENGKYNLTEKGIIVSDEYFNIDDNEIKEIIDYDLEKDKEITGIKIEEGFTELLTKEEAENLSKEYIEFLKGDNYKKNEKLHDWFGEVISRYPKMLVEWQNAQLDYLPKKEQEILEYIYRGELPNLKQFFNSLMKYNVGKKELIGLYELISERLVNDKLPKKVDFKFHPTDKGLSDIFKKIVSDDDLRPKLTGIYFDENGIVGTDAQKLIFISGKHDIRGIFSIGKNAGNVIDDVYPKYQAVIPKEVKDIVSIDRKKVEDILVALKTIKNSKYSVNDSVSISLYKGEAIQYNINYLIELLDAWLKIGFDKLEFSYLNGVKSKSVLFVSPNIKKFIKFEGSGSIVMAKMRNIDVTEFVIPQTEMYIDVPNGKAETAGITDDLYSELNLALGTVGAIDEKSQIEELETLVELLKEVVAENPKDLDSKDALELYEETLVELKKVNAEKFEKGGRVGCGCKHSFAKGGEVNYKKVIRRNLPINKEYKLVDSFYTGGIMENPMSCENCGRPIANVAVIEDEDGRKYDVGMDCAETLSQIKNSLEFNMAQNDFAEANAIRTKVKNALKKYPDAKLTIDNTYYGTVNIHVRNDRGIYVNSNLPKEFAFKYLPEFKNKISNPEKNGYVPRYKDNIKLDLDLASFKDKNAATKEVKLDDYKVVISREDRPNYNTETGEIRNYNNYIIVKVFKGEELIGERSFYMASDIVPKIISIINEYDFENFKEQFKYGGYIQSLSYSEILKRLKDEFGIDESDGKTIHSSDLMRIIQVDKNLDPNSGMNLAKVLTDNGWTIIRDKYEQGGLLESNGTKYFSKDFESKGNTWNVLFVWGKFNYVSVTKKTNNPFGMGVGKDFKNTDEAIAYYKNPDMKVQLIFAENEAKELGYVPKFENGGSIDSDFSIDEQKSWSSDKIRIYDAYVNAHNKIQDLKDELKMAKSRKDDELIKRINNRIRESEYAKKALEEYFNKFENGGEVTSDEITAKNWWNDTLSYNEQKKLLIDYAPEYSLDFIKKYPESAYSHLSRNIYNEGNDTILNIWKKEGSPKTSDYTNKMYGLEDLTDKDFSSKIFAKVREKNEGYLENGGELKKQISLEEIKEFYNLIESEGERVVASVFKESRGYDSGTISSLLSGYATGANPEEKYNLIQSINKRMIKKGDIVLFKCEGSETECRGEILDTLSKGEYLVSKGIKAVIVPKEKVIGIAPTKINTIFEKDFSIYDERVMAINSTLFHKTYGIGENPFEVNYDESNEYGYGIYFLDEKYSGVGKYKESRIISIKPNVKKPLIFLNDDGSSFNSNYKEAYDNAVKYDGVTSKDDFNKKMIEQGYDSMLISDIHGIHLIFFYNDPKLYEVKSDKGN